ncbi:DUF3794 domain-containing protein [Selenihalanaerobacter shriftii]|uniref:SipL SPOCS domain-containing protein n=1 Tax=Selenihalanaerobacter shriftii TaxID=142842 RepID=A0A1T4N6R9_9FIRM|nr:DUF3794 domain-containing protein [Selenihalanaerobacter shriftii]SJZ74902.1 protein of unknown function [Selenihalanaerobacter shriftii]
MAIDNSHKVKRATVQQIDLPVPAQKIRNIDAEVRDVTYEVIEDKIIIQGVIHKQIFFVGVDDVVYHRAEDLNFSTFIDVPGAEPGMEAQIHTMIEHISFELSADGTELHQKVVLEVFVKITDFIQIQLEEGNLGPYVLETVIGEGTTQEIVSNDFELQIPAQKITEVAAEIRDLQTEVIQDKVIIQGTLHKQIFFVGQDDVNYHQAENIDFSTFVDIPGVTEDSNVQVHPTIEDVQRSLSPDGTILSQDVIIEFFVKATETQQINVASEPEGFLLKLDRIINTNETQTMDVRDVTLNLPALKVSQVDTVLQDLDITVIPDKVIIQGVIDKQIFFVGLDDGVEHHQAEEVPFSTFVDVPGAQPGMDATVETEVELAQVELMDDQTTVHEKVVVRLIVTVTEEEQVSVATDGDGPLIKTRQVISEGTKQIIVQPPSPPTPPQPPVAGVEVDRVLIKEITGESASEQVLVEQEIELCPDAEVVNSVTGEVIPETLNFANIDGEFLVEGIVEKQVQYFDGSMTRNLTEEVGFQVIVPFPDVDPTDDIEADAVVENISFQLRDDGCTLFQAVTVEATVTAGTSRQLEVVTDVIGTGEAAGMVTTETIEVITQQVLAEGVAFPELQNTIDLTPAATEIIDIAATIEDVTFELDFAGEDDQVTVNGTIIKEITYATNGDEITTTEQIPFTVTVDITEINPNIELEPDMDLNIQVHPRVDDISFVLNETGDQLTQTIVLEVFVKVTETVELTVVTDVIGGEQFIDEIITEEVILDVVGDGQGPIPVEVVIDVI